MENAMKQAKNELYFKHCNNNIWKIEDMSTKIVMFYETKDDLLLNTEYGYNQIIIEECYQIIKKFDELNYYNRENFNIEFDSKENLYTNYNGNL
jgi:hypothetical protein